MGAYIHPDLGLFVASMIVLAIYIRLYIIMDKPGGSFFISLVGILLFVIASFFNWFEETPYEYLMLAYTDEDGWDFIIPVFFYAPGGLLMCWGFAEWTRLALVLKAKVAEQHQDELKLRKALAEAHEANELKRLFLKALNHELRSPLDALVGFSEILKLKQHDHGEDPAEVYYADTIHRSSANLLRITEDLVQLGDLGDQDFKLKRERISLYPFLSDITATVEDNTSTTGKLFVETTDQTVFLDHGLVKRLIVRLLIDLNSVLQSQHRITLSANTSKNEEDRQSVLIRIDAQLSIDDLLLATTPKSRFGEILDRQQLQDHLGLTQVLMVLAEHLMTLHGGMIMGEVRSHKQFHIDLAFPVAK